MSLWNPSDDARRKRDEQIAAYLDGELTPDETATFENRMQRDESLRREVAEWREALEAARDWMTSDAPGLERAAQLAIPWVAGRAQEWGEGPLADARGSEVVGRAQGRAARVLTIRPLVWRVAAAAAIFIAGVFVGQRAKPGIAPSDRVIIQAPSPARPTQETETTPAVRQERPPEPSRPEVAALGPRYMDERGRLVVETTLRESGARALWVIDGDFQIAQSFPK